MNQTSLNTRFTRIDFDLARRSLFTTNDLYLPLMVTTKKNELKNHKMRLGFGFLHLEVIDDESGRNPNHHIL